MAKNWVQLQTGYSLNAFYESYGAEDKSQDKLFEFRWPNGFHCPKCNHIEYYQLKCRQLLQCCKCRYQCSLTAGTIFASSKLPLTIWFLAIYLTTQDKEGMSALSLRRWLGISVNAAFRLKQKLQHAMKNADDRLVLEGLIELDDVYWGGKRKGGKRGRGAPGKTPFLAAISRNKEGHPIYMRMSKVDAFNFHNIRAWTQKHLHPGAVVISDAYNPFNCLSELVAFHGTIKASKVYDDPKNKIFHWVNTMIGNVKRAIHGTYHAVSHKHLPRYLAEFCIRFNNRFEMGSMVNILIKECTNLKPKPLPLLKLAEN